MKSLVNGRFVIAVLTIACLTIVLLTVAPIRSGSPSAGEYDAWLDWNDDGKIDMKDISRAARAFGTNGTSIDKASIDYDSGWIDITDKAGQDIVISHGLNSTDIMVDIQGKTSQNGGVHQISLTGYLSGWSKAYGGTAYDFGYSAIQTRDGGYALAGRTESFGVGGKDFWLVKTDAAGNAQWNKTYGGTLADVAYSLVQTADNGYALAGTTDSYGAGSSDFWLVKTDAAGNAQWNKTYGGIGYDDVSEIVQAADGGYALAGITDSYGAGNSDFWLVKTDAAGNAQWNKTYGGTGYDVAYSFVWTTDGGYALAGTTDSYGAGSNSSWLVKTDAAGNAQWNKTYGGADFDWTSALIQTTDGGYALAGGTYSYGAGNDDFWLVKTDAAGNAQWNKTYGGADFDWTSALIQTTDGGYALAGGTYSYGAGNDDFWLVKTDAAGNAQWNKTYGGEFYEGATSLIQTKDGGYALVGFAPASDVFNSACRLVKTDADGNAQWNKTYEEEARYNMAHSLIQTKDGGYVLAGTMLSYDLVSSFDFWLVKTDVENGLAWVDSNANSITLYRGSTDPYWNYVRVRLWKPHETP